MCVIMNKSKIDDDFLNAIGKEIDLMGERFLKFLTSKRKSDKNPAEDQKRSKYQDAQQNKGNEVDCKHSEQQIDLSMMAKSEIAETSEEKSEKEAMWYMDSGCSRHMTRDPTRFISLSYKTSCCVTYGDNNKDKVVGIGKIQTLSSYIIENVLLVDGLKHNLLSINQLCDKGLKSLLSLIIV
ncbi:uncharacterized protein LOC108347874 [Vigna angularis]|uniref:uncharacterized protein LOC108347874 n=1 Tax=Phaseolus angularis TaxID=3914 RepID=UPI00080A170B|nr:uncharacterized protein LOC108347874 [Vigna angularis]